MMLVNGFYKARAPRKISGVTQFYPYVCKSKKVSSNSSFSVFAWLWIDNVTEKNDLSPWNMSWKLFFSITNLTSSNIVPHIVTTSKPCYAMLYPMPIEMWNQRQKINIEKNQICFDYRSVSGTVLCVAASRYDNFARIFIVRNFFQVE